MKNLVWTEKYRPKTFDEFIGDTAQIKELVKTPMSMPNFLFVSKSPGTGKTSLAYVIKNEIKCPNTDFLITNSSDERKIESIRGMVKDFAMTQRSKRNVPRVVLMDEIDGMLSASQEALRFIMEKYSGNCKFIMTANNEEKIIEPIKSRCVVVRMKEIDKTKIQTRLIDIANKERMNTGDESFAYAITKLIKIHYPDMRQMINHLQELAPDITLEKVKTKTELEDMFYDLLIQKKPFDARKFAIGKALDPFDTLRRVLEKVVEKSADPNECDQVKEITYEVSDSARWMAVGADPEIELFRFALKFCDIWG